MRFGPLRRLRQLRCVRCVGWWPRFTPVCSLLFHTVANVILCSWKYRQINASPAAVTTDLHSRPCRRCSCQPRVSWRRRLVDWQPRQAAATWSGVIRRSQWDHCRPSRTLWTQHASRPRCSATSDRHVCAAWRRQWFVVVPSVRWMSPERVLVAPADSQLWR